MADEHILKLVTTTKAGSKIKVPATVTYEAGRIWFVKSPYALKDELKAMKGARWHGYDPVDPRKIWSVLNCERNQFQLRWLRGEDAYEWWDKPLQHWEYDRPLYEHQVLMADHMLTYHYSIIAGEMGCIDGDAIVHVNRAGKGFKFSLRELCYKFHGGKSYGGKRRCGTNYSNRIWDSSIDTYIRGFRGNCLGLTKIKDVVLQGKKPVKCITTCSGKILNLTSDHEICVDSRWYGTFKPLENLRVGDLVMVAAPEGFTKDSIKVQQNLPPKLEKTTKQGLGHFIDKDGYIRVSGIRKHPRAYAGQVQEHILVLEEVLGRLLRCGEEVHHLNGQRWDNRPENLVLCNNRQDHLTRFHNNHVENLYNGEKASTHYFVFESIITIKDGGETDVYDVMCEGPYHNFVANEIVVKNCGKTLSAIETMEKSKWNDFFWVGPKSALAAVEREFEKWGLSSEINIQMMTYERLRSIMKGWKDGDVPPPGVIFDESSRLKGPTAQRTTAAQNLADSIREHYGKEGFVIEMSGTPSPKSPVDWWSQAEIAWPGFLREGDPKSFERRMGIFVEKETMQGKHLQRVTWLDDENKCKICGGYEEDEQHTSYDDHVLTQDEFVGQTVTTSHDCHPFEKSFNEVAYLHERLNGLVLVLHKKDCLDLPEKQFRTIRLQPSATITRVAKALVKVAPNVITGLTWTRELSDGFQYKNVEDGVEKCPVCKDGMVEIWVDPEDSDRTFEMTDMLDQEYVDTLEKRQVECLRCGGSQEISKFIRTVKEIPCPKDAAVRQLLDENEEQGRLVIFAGFTGSIDRITAICLKHNWAVVKIDGRGWKVYDFNGNPVLVDKPLNYWADLDNNARVVIVSHPLSGGLGLNLTESRMAVFYSNDFNPESRSQAMDRIHRMGMDENKGATIVDLIHLPTDERVRDVLQDNRRLELMTLGDMEKLFGEEE